MLEQRDPAPGFAWAQGCGTNRSRFWRPVRPPRHTRDGQIGHLDADRRFQRRAGQSRSGLHQTRHAVQDGTTLCAAMVRIRAGVSAIRPTFVRRGMRHLQHRAGRWMIMADRVRQVHAGQKHAQGEADDEGCFRPLEEPEESAACHVGLTGARVLCSDAKRVVEDVDLSFRRPCPRLNAALDRRTGANAGL